MLFSGGALVSARLCRLPEQEVHQPSKKNLPRNQLAERRLPQIARIFTDSLGALISQLIKRIPAACEKNNGLIGLIGCYFQGVHLSPLGFAACQSKKCTNRARSAPKPPYRDLVTPLPQSCNDVSDTR